MEPRRTIVALACIFGVRSASAQSAEPPPGALPPCPEIVARVNGQAIALKRVRLLVELALRQDAAAAEHRTDAYQNGVNEMIRRELMYEEAQAHHFSPEPAALADAEKQVRGSFPDEKASAEFLAAQGFDRVSYREEVRIEETARLYSGCIAEERVPLATDAEAIAIFRAYNTGADPTPHDVESWRIQLTRNKRQLELREVMDAAYRKAAIERFYVPGQCAVPVPLK